jgi:fructose-1,6-bisphosphatase I
MTFTSLSAYMAEVCCSKSRYKNLDKVVLAIAEGAIDIQNSIRFANLSGVVGSNGEVNVQGEIVQFLDTLASDTFVKTMTDCEQVSAIGCEEIDDIVLLKEPSPDNFIVQMDPLDGSSNIDVAISTGSIFGIWPSLDDEHDNRSMLRPGNKQVAALYTLYGSSTLLVIALENSVQGFTLNPVNETFELSHQDIKLPSKSPYYSVNEGNFDRFDQPTQKAVAHLRSNYSLRYVGSLIADFHRNLLKGGVFLYPQDSAHPDGKLRLMYEANPLSYIIEQAGGSSSSGSGRILMIEPDSVHQRTPLIIGNTELVDEAIRLITNSPP